MPNLESNKTQEEFETDLSLLDRLLDEQNDDNIFLFNEDGEEIELEQIAVVTHENAIYAILRPLTAAEDEACVFRIDTEDEESMHIVDDEVLAEKILGIYHEKSQ